MATGNQTQDITEEDIKVIATEFFYWWYNQPGANTQQGFDEYWQNNKGRYGFKKEGS